MKTFKQQLLDLLGLKTKEEFAVELYDLLEKYKSSIAVRLEREYIFRDSGEFVTTDCFVTPPAKGEFYITEKAIYEVMQVTHSYKPREESGTIQVKKVRELKSK